MNLEKVVFEDEKKNLNRDGWDNKELRILKSQRKLYQGSTIFGSFFAGFVHGVPYSEFAFFVPLISYLAFIKTEKEILIENSLRKISNKVSDLFRNEKLDEYLLAHEDFKGSKKDLSVPLTFGASILAYTAGLFIGSYFK